ncbi:hypothetical protein Mapa_016672 [Marchantia paleacea]|nr:hypothetical protein Mapa_016672 [Marchantia paleacea]
MRSKNPVDVQQTSNRLVSLPCPNPLRPKHRDAACERRRWRMTITFVLLVNRQGQTRLAQYYEYLSIEERRALEGEIVRKCLARSDQQCSFVEHRNYKIIYRRYASLFFLVGVDGDENELAILEFIHCVVETLDRYFGNVCELDIMFHLEKAHFMLEEMVMNGCIVEINKQNILTPIQLMDKSSNPQFKLPLSSSTFSVF